MADAIIGSTETDAVKQALISTLVQRELAFQAKLVSTVRDVSQFAEEGAKSIEFPKFGSFTVINRAEGSAGDAEALSFTTDKLDLSFNAYVAWIVDSKSKIQSRPDVEAEAATRAASAHGRYVDLQILAELNTVAGLNVNGASPADIDEDDVLDMREFILSNDGILENTTLVVPPSQEKAMLKIDRFTNNDIYGRAVIPSGFIGTVHGVTVVVHNGFSGQQAYMYERDGIALGFQKGASMDEQPANEYGVGAKRRAMDQLFGVKGQQLGEKGLAATLSPLVAKLAD